MTASAVSAFGLPIPARTRLTVAVETPARRATSRIVEGAERSLTPVPYEIGPHLATPDGQRRRLQATFRPLSRIPSCLREPIPRGPTRVKAAPSARNRLLSLQGAARILNANIWKALGLALPS